MPRRRREDELAAKHKTKKGAKPVKGPRPSDQKELPRRRYDD